MEAVKHTTSTSTILIPSSVDIDDRLIIKGPVTIKSNESGNTRRRARIKSGTDIDWSASRIDCPVDELTNEIKFETIDIFTSVSNDVAIKVIDGTSFVNRGVSLKIIDTKVTHLGLGCTM